MDHSKAARSWWGYEKFKKGISQHGETARCEYPEKNGWFSVWRILCPKKCLPPSSFAFPSFRLKTFCNEVLLSQKNFIEWNSCRYGRAAFGLWNTFNAFLLLRDFKGKRDPGCGELIHRRTVVHHDRRDKNSGTHRKRNQHREKAPSGRSQEEGHPVAHWR